jgi:DNA processing protein
MPQAPDEELHELLRLTLVPGIGPATFRALLDHFGTARRVGRASLGDLRQVPGVGSVLAERIVASRTEVDPKAELLLCQQHKVILAGLEHPSYPTLLRDIHDPPPLLYIRGTVEPADSFAIALVGSRRCTPYGIRTAESLARSLGRAGLTVVSGLARGIDAAAHRGALRGGGRTLAIVANGLEEIYPPEHRDLAEQIAASGAILSEMPMRQKPLAGLFPQRNRLIAGLCLGVVVVEAAPRSGSLITAQHAMEQNREVFAVPGPVDSLTSRGCHQLLRDGARLVETVDDILEELAPKIRDRLPARHQTETDSPADSAELPPPSATAGLSLNEQERSILAQLDDLPRPADELITRTGLTASQVMATLSVLEMRRLIRRMPGNQFVKL